MAANHPEALVQLTRLLGDGRLRDGDVDSVRSAVDECFERLVSGLVDEAASSDDVTDRESAILFLDDRLLFFRSLIDNDQRSRLRAALLERIQSW